MPVSPGGADAFIVTVSEAVVLELAVAAATIVTLPVSAGAVYVVVAPLAVWVGLNAPQSLVGVQLQSTPAFVESLVTVAAIVAVAVVFSESGGGVLRVIATFGAGALTVTVATAVVDDCAVAAATIVMLPAVAGAVYVVAAPLAVCAGLNVPQAPAGMQLQSTPAFVLSFVTVATTLLVAPVFSVDDGAVVIAIEICGLVALDPPPHPLEIARNTVNATPSRLRI